MEQQLLLQHMLLQQTTNLRNKREELKQQTGGHFNIFSILQGMQQKEVIGRFLYDLLNPLGSHGQRDLYTALFAKYVLHTTLDRELRVFRHYLTSDNERLDLVIQTKSQFFAIMIEPESPCVLPAKLTSSFYYVTPFGHAAETIRPSIAVSFEKDMTRFVKQALCQYATINMPPLREVLMQFLQLLRKMTNQLGDEQQMELKHTLASSPEMMKSAFSIEKTLQQTKIDLIRRIFEDLDAAVPLKRLTNEQDYLAPNKLDDYYKQHASTKPGLTYMFTEIYRDVHLLFRIELDDRLYAGFMPTKPLSAQEVTRFLPHIEQPFFDGEFVYWELLPVDDIEQVPSFKNQSSDDLYFTLFDNVAYRQFINEAVATLDRLFLDYL